MQLNLDQFNSHLISQAFVTIYTFELPGRKKRQTVVFDYHNKMVNICIYIIQGSKYYLKSLHPISLVPPDREEQFAVKANHIYTKQKENSRK